MSVVPGRAVGRQNGPCLLLTAVRVDQPAPHQPRVRPLLKGSDQGIQPARLHLSVVVEKHQIRAGRRLGSLIARVHESQIAGVPNDPNTFEASQLLRRLVF